MENIFYNMFLGGVLGGGSLFMAITYYFLIRDWWYEQKFKKERTKKKPYKAEKKRLKKLALANRNS